MTTIGPNLPSIGADDASFGEIAWTNPGNITLDDGTSAVASSSGAPGFKDVAVSLVLAGTAIGQNKATDASLPVGTPTIFSYGGASDLWEISLADTDINDSNFGAAVSYRRTDTGTQTHYLKGTSFGFSIPSGSTILGVQLDLKAFYNATGKGGAIGNANVDYLKLTVTYSPPVTSRAIDSRDGNGVPAIIAVSNTDGATIVAIQANPTTHALEVSDGTTGTDLSAANARRDQNSVPASQATSTDEKTPIMLYGDQTDGKLLIKST